MKLVQSLFYLHLGALPGPNLATSWPLLDLHVWVSKSETPSRTPSGARLGHFLTFMLKPYLATSWPSSPTSRPPPIPILQLMANIDVAFTELRGGSLPGGDQGPDSVVSSQPHIQIVDINQASMKIMDGEAEIAVLYYHAGLIKKVVRSSLAAEYPRQPKRWMKPTSLAPSWQRRR